MVSGLTLTTSMVFSTYLNANPIFLGLLNVVSAIPVSVPNFQKPLKIPKDLGQNLLQESLPSSRFFATICEACQRFFVSRLSKICKIFKDLPRQVHMGSERLRKVLVWEPYLVNHLTIAHLFSQISPINKFSLRLPTHMKVSISVLFG